MLSDAVNTVIGDIYRCALDDSLWQPTLLALSRVTGGVGAAIMPQEIQSPLRFGSSRIPEADHIYYSHMWQHDPYRIHLSRQPSPQGELSDTSFVSDVDMAHSPYYQDFLRKFDASRTNRFYFDTPGLPRFALSIQRPLGHPHETPDERRLRLMLGQHVCRALAMSVAQGRTRAFAHGFREICHRMPTAAAVLDHDGRVLFMNDAMERVLGDGVSYIDGHIICSHRASQRQLDRLLHDTLHAATGPEHIAEQITGHTAGHASEYFVSVHCPSGRPLLARAIPLMPENTGQPAYPMALLAFHRPGADIADMTQALRLLGLNSSEARLVQQMSNGLSIKEAARALGISDHYARSMLRHVYEKLEVNSQGKLAAFVRDLPTQ
ncbi:helix-turn-helix transcriptional regulator [Novacetimonas hansenii]|uniref:helix-turn-helix transcriptional regulator n=1 Tax=Novacetimonas hansenii TaxID=436 RepID=UPI00248EA1A0|nr:PAS domain-containing protein [Novacetimonas hansenii]